MVKQKDKGSYTEMSEYHSNSSMPNIGVIVGAVLGALAFIGVIVLLIILKFRKTKAAADRIYIQPDVIGSRTCPMYTNIQRKKLLNNKTMNRIYENESSQSGGPIPVGTTDNINGHEQEGKNPMYVNTVIMTNNMTSP